MLQFLMDHLLVIIIALVVLFVIIPIIKNMFSTAITIIVVVLLLGALGVFGPKFFDNIKEPVAVTKEFAQNTIQPVIKDELAEADFTYDQNSKQYTIQSKSFKLQGIANENKADIIFKDNKYRIDVTFLKEFIQNQIVQQTENK